MKYTYRDECIIRDRNELAGFFALAFYCCVPFVFFFMDIYLITFKNSDGAGGFLIGAMFSVVPLVIAVNMYRSIRKRRQRALEWRRSAMTLGVRYDGRILDAGVEIEFETYDVKDENNHWEKRHKKVPNYWILVEYPVAETGEMKQFKAIHFVKPMGPFIGSGVDVYVWHEWSEYIHKDLTLTYIDTAGLH